MENILKVNAESRTEVGKKISKQLRNKGRIPAIIYGLDKESIPIAINLDEIKAILKAEKGLNSLLRIERDGEAPVEAMLKEVQWDYLSNDIIHADLIRIDMGKKLTLHIPVHVTGEPIGVKLEDGIFDFMTRSVEVRCLPTQIPTEIVLDVSGLHAGQSIKVEDLEIGEGVRFVTEPTVVICLVATKGGSSAGGEAEDKGEAE